MSYELVKLPETQPRQGSSPQHQLAEAGRHSARTIARASESILGLPGDIASTAFGLGSALTSGAIPEYSKVQEALPLSLPTSEQVRKGTQALTGQSLEPESESERFADEIVGDLATLLLPVKGKLPFKSAIVRAVGGNLASFAAKELGAGTGGQATAKIGFNLISGLPGGRRQLTKMRDESLKTVNEIAKTNPALSSTFKSYNTIVKGLRNPGLDELDRASLELMESKLGKTLKQVGSRNEQFKEAFETYMDIDKGLNTSSKIGQFLNEHAQQLKKFLKNPISTGLFGYYLGYNIPKALAKAAGTMVGTEVVKTIDFLRNSQKARQYYGDVLKSAARGSVPATARSLAKLDKEADKFSSKQEPENAAFEVIKL